MVKIKKFQTLLKQYVRVAVDASIFIYQFEQHPQFEPLCSVLFDGISTRQLQLTTSTITVSEVMIKPVQLSDTEVVTLYEGVFTGLPNFTLLDVDYVIAKLAAYIRAHYRILLPNAIHIASALQAKADVFITNDEQLKTIREIKVICLKDYVS